MDPYVKEISILTFGDDRQSNTMEGKGK